jgi:hypothetical protein
MWQNFGNLRWIDRCRHVALDDLQFSASGLVRDCRYLSLDNFAAVEADPDAGAYAIVHVLKCTPLKAVASNSTVVSRRLKNRAGEPRRFVRRLDYALARLSGTGLGSAKDSLD